MKSKDDIIRELQGAGLGGSMTANDEVRARRGSQAEQAVEQRFNQDQFEVKDGRVNLRERSRPLTKTDLIQFINREADGAGTIALNAGIYSGPGMLDVADEASATWVLPNDMDRTQKAVLTLGIAQSGTDAGANTLTLDVFAYVPGTAGDDLEGAPTQTETATITSTANSFDDHAATFTMIPSLCFGSTVTAILFKATFTTMFHANTDFVMHHAEVEYTTRYYHTHERD